ncbi:MAG TPA: response regulator [Hyphomicrobiaceae bacterium]|nr:response regulator [Hyphomicrobiaceae bacterium]
MRCLVIDDSDVIRRVARRLLEDFGFEVAEAEDAGRALAACRVEMPDLIIVDWLLPSMSGCDFLVQLRALIVGRKPAVIYCTSEYDEAAAAVARAAGADDILLKPFDRQSLTASLAATGVTMPA